MTNTLNENAIPHTYWDINVDNLLETSKNSNSFAEHLNPDDWNISEIKDLRNLFSHSKTFNGNISEWDFSSFSEIEGDQCVNLISVKGLSKWNTTQDYWDEKESMILFNQKIKSDNIIF